MTTDLLRKFYLTKKEENESLLKNIQQNIRFISILRLSVVIFAIVFIYLFHTKGSLVITSIISASIFLMLVLIKKHGKLFYAKDYYLESIRSYQNELHAIDYDFSVFDDGKERMNKMHPFSFDIDLFGEKSLFQSLNRTVTPYGKNILADWFEYPLKEKKEITDRQEVIKELQKKNDLRQKFRVTGLLFSGKETDISDLRKFVDEKSLLLPFKRYFKLLALLYPCFWILLITLVILKIWSISVLGIAIIVLYGLSESQAKKINIIQRSLDKKVKILSTYSDLIKIIEEDNASSEELAKLKKNLTKKGKNISILIKDLSSYLSNLDQRSGGLGRFILNTLLLWDIRYALKIEEWKETNGKDLNHWMKTLGTYDAFCSLGTFAFNHSEYVYPTPIDSYFSFQAEALGHPLMHRDICVKNDIHIDQHPFFMIITGANMAGKSTYLRTVAVNYLLASIGAPVCANKFLFSPAQLVTGIRTSDSLTDNESYFFAELKRLKMIIDRLKNGEKLFIILDEILKGTNSVDKQKGSIALMKQLVNMDTCGIIATHDLALGNLSEIFPENIKNYRFEADIHEDKLTFSYTLQRGIAKNMNACFLMKKMGITIE